MAVVFDGVDDRLVFGGLNSSLLNVPVGAYTIAVLHSRTTWSRAWDGLVQLADTTDTAFSTKASVEWQSTTILTMQDAGNNRNWTHGLGSLGGIPLLLVFTRTAGTATNFEASVLNINTGTWTHGSAASSANRAAVASGGGLHFGFASGDFFLGKYGVCAIWSGIYMDQTARMACGTNKKTSDLAKHASGAPHSLIEFRSLTPTDLKGGVSNIVVNSAPTLDNADALGWTYDGLGLDMQQIRPDADLATTGWSTAPLFSKINDSSDATVVTGVAS